MAETDSHTVTVTFHTTWETIPLVIPIYTDNSETVTFYDNDKDSLVDKNELVNSANAQYALVLDELSRTHTTRAMPLDM